MSISFATDMSAHRVVVSCCLCAQMSPHWQHPGAPDTVAALRADANPECHLCDGSGIEASQVPADGDEVNFANEYAYLVLRVLGYPMEGEAEIGAFASACELALAGSTQAPRPAEQSRYFALAGDRIVFGASVLVAELSVADVRGRIERLLSFANGMAARGATVVRWG